MFLNITCGVPQGSVLGPKLFTTYINDICRVTNILRFVVFADDTTILFSGEGFKDLKLSLNSSKTKFMLFGNREMFITGDWKLIKYPMKEYLKRDLLESINQTLVKQDLKNHRDFGENKVRPEQYKIAHTLLHIATTIFKYCVEIWGNTYKSPLQNICTMQNKAIRIIHNIWYREETKKFFLITRLSSLSNTLCFCVTDPFVENVFIMFSVSRVCFVEILII